MAQNGRFALSLRVLTYLAGNPGGMHTSAVIGTALGTSPVMVRRVFAPLHKAGLIVQRKGPSGGAQLKISAKEIGFGDVFAAVGGNWLSMDDKAAEPVLKAVRKNVIAAMNESSIASLAKKLKQASS